MAAPVSFNQIRRTIFQEKALSFEQIEGLATLDLSHRFRRGNQLFHLSAYKGHLQALRWLHLLGADINARNRNGNTPLHCAAHQGKEQAISLLVQMGCSLDNQNHKGYTPLITAYLKGEKGSTLQLRSLGASTIPRSKKGWTARMISLMCNDATFSILFPPDGISDELVHRKIVGHRLGIAQTTQIRGEKYRLESGFHPIMMKTIASSFHEYTQDRSPSCLPLELCKRLMGAFHSASFTHSQEELAATIQSGELVVMPAGWLHHAIALIFFDSCLAICNRGAGTPKQRETIVCYAINPKQVTAAVIKEINGMDDQSCAKGSHFFYFTLPEKLSPATPAQVTPSKQYAPVLQLAQKLSKHGFCTDASSQEAFLCAAALLKIQHVKPSDISSCLDAVKREVKDFSSYLRVKAVVNWVDLHFRGRVDFEHHPEKRAEMDEELLRKALIKLSARLTKYPPVIGSPVYHAANQLFARCAHFLNTV
jgi:hypothetical protein